jgi:hypothetical protein
MNKLPKWLGRTLKVIGWLCLIPVCLIVLAVFIGWIGDLTASAKWQAERQKAQERIEKLKTSEFSSGYAFAVNEANAWDYYLKASETLDSLKTGKLDSLVFGKSFDPKEANRFLTEYKKEIALWDSGACSRYCRTPFEYEKGYSAPLPKYMSLQKMLKLALIKGRLELASGRIPQGALTYSKALKTAMDFSGGSETIIGRMVGTVAGNYVKRVIAGDIARFDPSSVVQLQDAVERAGKTWPATYPSISMEAASIYIGADGQDAMAFIENGSESLSQANPLAKAVRRAGYSLLCWKHFFSLKRNMMNFAALQQETADEAAGCRAGLWSSLEPVLKRNEEHIRETSKGDVFATIAMPNHRQFFKREYELRMGLRVLKDALVLREYRLKNGKYPFDLVQAVKDSPEFNDIADGRPLHYVRQGNAVLLYSVGLNLKNEEGKNFVLSEGITRSSDNEARDDIGIKLE